MTIETQDGNAHPGDLGLRRFRVGEFTGDARTAVEQHVTACGPCRARLSDLADEQRAFESQIPFARFTGGVERARRVPRTTGRRSWILGAGLSSLAAAAFLLTARPSIEQKINQTKGSAGLATFVLRIAQADGHRQRNAAATESLAQGDLLRLGYRVTQNAFMAALSVDKAGQVSFIEPASGAALPVQPNKAVVYLPDSIALDGTGEERITVFVATQPFDVADAARALQTAHTAANRNLAAMSPPTLDATAGVVETNSWLLQKP